MARPDIVTSVPPPVSFPKTPMGTNPLLGSYVKTRFPFMPEFTLPMANKGFPCSMPTIMMASLQTNAFIYADNATTTFSPYNTHLAPGSALSNPGRNAQPSLTTNSLLPM